MTFGTGKAIGLCVHLCDFSESVYIPVEIECDQCTHTCNRWYVLEIYTTVLQLQRFDLNSLYSGSACKYIMYTGMS